MNSILYKIGKVLFYAAISVCLITCFIYSFLENTVDKALRLNLEERRRKKRKLKYTKDFYNRHWKIKSWWTEAQAKPIYRIYRDYNSVHDYLNEIVKYRERLAVYRIIPDLPESNIEDHFLQDSIELFPGEFVLDLEKNLSMSSYYGDIINVLIVIEGPKEFIRSFREFLCTINYHKRIKLIIEENEQ